MRRDPEPEPAPVVARIAGLTARVLEGIGSPRCVELGERIEQVRRELADRRARAVDALYEALPAAAPEHRRLLLNVKRDCFNGRPLTRHANQDGWAGCQQQAGGLLDEILALESSLERLEAEHARTYEEEREREEQAVLRHLDDRDFLRGVTLASADLVESLGRRREERGTPRRGRRDRRATSSFLRYLSRAALKLSPFSTLTRIGLAEVRNLQDSAVRFLDEPRRDRSLVRAKRYLLDQCCDLLFLLPGVRRHLHLSLNNSLEALEDDHYRFLRTFHIEEAGTSGSAELDYTRPAQVKVRLSGALPKFLIDRLGPVSLPYGELREELSRRFGEEDPDREARIDQALTQLLSLGLLSVAPPWPGYEPHLEVRLVAFLESLPPGAVPEPVVARASELLELEQTFCLPQTDQVAALRRIDETMDALYAAIKAAVSPSSSLFLKKKENRNYYEDVFLHSAVTPDGAVVQVDRKAMEEALEAGTLIWQIAGLIETRHEFLLALEHFLDVHCPGQESVDLLLLFSQVRPLWEEYLDYLSEDRTEPFDPYGKVRESGLPEFRARVLQGLSDAMEEREEAEVFPLEPLRRLVAEIPPRYLMPVRPCLFLQPCDPWGTRWIANRIFEGTGRMSSRFNVAMDPALARRYTGFLEEHSAVQHGGEVCELLDLLFTKGNTVNAHLPQTRQVLVSPGETCDLPPWRQLRLGDLVLRRGGPSVGLRLQDRAGQTYLACFLSPLHTPFMPTILKFLDLFGVTARARFGLPGRPVRNADGVIRVRRQVVGNLTIRRQRWVAPSTLLPSAELPPAEFFLAMNRWRRNQGIPKRVYFIEKVREITVATDTFKPQYLDFGSPSFVSIFQDWLRLGHPEVSLDEALPSPEGFPLDPLTGPRAVEVLLEGIALEPLHPILTPAETGTDAVFLATEALTWSEG